MNLRVHEGGGEGKAERHPEQGQEHGGEKTKAPALRQECCTEGTGIWQEVSGNDQLQELWSKEGTHPTRGEDGCSVCAHMEEEAFLHLRTHQKRIKAGCQQVHYTSHPGQA